MKKLFISMAALFAMATTVSAESLEVSGGADFVSKYVCRGIDQGMGASIQPSLGLSIGGFSIGGWASSPFDFLTGSKEVDYTVGYEVGNFSVAVTDYWWAGEGNPYFGKVDGIKCAGHKYEATLAYTICESFPLSVAVSTMFAGDDSVDGKQHYSTYIALDYPFAIGSVDCNVNLGITPNGSVQYSNGASGDKEFGISNISFRASKDIEITDKFAIPVFSEVMFSPYNKDANIVFGMSLGF